MEREYYITLKSLDVVDSFRDDMETPGGNLYIPDRMVECCRYAEIGRTLHYMLTDEEAEIVRLDDRVEGVELNFKESGISFFPFAVPAKQTSSYWDLSNAVTNNMVNWGLIRCTRPRPTLNAGDFYPDGFGPLADQPSFNSKAVGYRYLPFDTLKMTVRTSVGWSTAGLFWDIPTGIKSGKSWGDYASTGYFNTTLTATFEPNATGKNVDLVVVDGGIVDTGHPEYAKNPDGSGGSRCVKYNWYQHNSALGHGPNGTYNYSGGGVSPFGHTITIDSHAMHCTGTAAGITQGWAREANIYNISFNEPNVIDYVRQFHKNKPVNPVTGRKNPTVCTNSWGQGPGSITSTASVTKVVYRGTTYNGPFTAAQLHNWGIYLNESLTSRSPSLDASVNDAIKEGIIFIAAAGNFSFRHDLPSGPDYNNTVTVTYAGAGSIRSGTYFYNQGVSPGTSALPDVKLCIGALDTLPWDAKAPFSNCGPAIDFYAPGVNIMSSYLNSTNINPAVRDPRNIAYYLQKLQGTSMATPQVSGIAACLAETYPYWTNKELKKYLIDTCDAGKIADAPTTYRTGFPWVHYDIKGSPNRIAMFYPQRQSTGITWPKTNTNSRPSSGPIVYPRPKIGKK
jgi:hypothetical protein